MSIRPFDSRMDDETRFRFLDLPDERTYRVRLWLETGIETIDYAMATRTATEPEIQAFQERVARYKAHRDGGNVHPFQSTDGRIHPSWT